MLCIEELPFYSWIEPYYKSGQVRLVTAPKGSCITGTEGDPYAMHYILDGCVRVLYVSASGRNFLLDEVGEGQFCGYLTKVLGHKFQPELIAAETCTLLYFPAKKFEEILKTPEFAAFFFQRAADRVYYTYQKLLLNNLFSQKEMIAFYIYMHCKDRFFTGTLSDLEEEMVISRRSVFYILKQLRDEGILMQKGKKYYIADMDKMEECVRDIREFKESLQ